MLNFSALIQAFDDNDKHFFSYDDGYDDDALDDIEDTAAKNHTHQPRPISIQLQVQHYSSM